MKMSHVHVSPSLSLSFTHVSQLDFYYLSIVIRCPYAFDEMNYDRYVPTYVPTDATDNTSSNHKLTQG